jgi:gliding motility-associated lipoprotein GldD
MNNKYISVFILCLISCVLCLISCRDDYQPKPRGYFRIDLPKKEYKKFDSDYPYSFEYPLYSKVIPDTERGAEPYWINIVFPKYKGTVHISYKSVKNNVLKYFEDSRTFAMKHMSKANSIDERLFNNRRDRVYGLIYNIEGTNAASTYQFYLTDSTSHFLRGALYFQVMPNNDSLSPVINFIKQDIDHIINTFRWKQTK